MAILPAAVLLSLAACQDTGRLSAAYLPAGRPPANAIPFGQASSPAPREAARVTLGASFEFVEGASGYTLNALVQDRASGDVRRVRIGHCRVIDLDSFDESSRSLFAEPVLCDGRSYAFDIVGTRVIVSGGHETHTVYRLAPGPVLLNGVPVLAGA